MSALAAVVAALSTKSGLQMQLQPIDEGMLR